MGATLMALTEDEQDWIEAQLAAVQRFVADYGSSKSAPGLAAVDHAWAAWLDRQEVEPEDPDTVINVVAVALGQALVDGLDGFAWVTVFEDGDTDLAVSGLPALDVLIFPADLVAKEYQTRTPAFLAKTLDNLIADVDQLRA